MTTPLFIGPLHTRDVYTTGQVAQLIRVAPRTVSKWVDSGLLPGYRIPGSNDRRIPRNDLLRFLVAHDLPFGKLIEPAPLCVLLVGADAELFDRLRHQTPTSALTGTEVRLQLAGSLLEAGMLLPAFEPDVVVLDLVLGRSCCLTAVRVLTGRPRPVQAIALANEDEGQPGELRAAGFSDVLVKPFDVTQLAEKLRAA